MRNGRYYFITGGKMQVNYKQLFRRFLFMVIGSAITGCGVAISTRAQLGITPISSIPYVLSQIFPLSMGTFMNMTSAVFWLGQWAILKKRFKADRLLQLVATIVFGFFIDFFNSVFQNLSTDVYLIQWILLIVSTLITAVGLAVQVIAGFALMPTEAFVQVVASEKKIDFGKFKTIFDLSMSGTSVALSFIFLKKLIGIREGTLFGAVFIGQIISAISPKLRFISRYIESA